MAIPPGLASMLHDGVPVTPREAASVLLIDTKEAPWRLLMIRRPGGADFAPSAHVFPGGSVHDADRDFADTSRAAGLRELFEEVGILLARRPDGRFARQEDCDRLRQLVDQGLPWPAALQAAGLVPAFDRLVFLTRWVTPDRLVRRFDTRFFLARRPPSQEIRPQPGEVDEWLWVTPADALAGELTLVHATQRILEWVAPEPDARLLFGRLRRRRRESPAIQPELVELPDGGFRVVDPESVRKLAGAGKRQRQLSRQRS